MRIELFSGVFWGIYFIIVGSLALLKSFSNINIPLFRLAIGILLIYIGVVFALGGHPGIRSEPGTVLMEKRITNISGSGEHSTIFGEGIFHVSPPSEGQTLNLKFNSIFASTVIHVPSDTPVKVTGNVAFGSISTPDGSSAIIGDRSYTTPGYREGKTGAIYIEANAVFGSLIIRH